MSIAGLLVHKLRERESKWGVKIFLTILLSPAVDGPASEAWSNLGGSHNPDSVILKPLQVPNSYFLLHGALFHNFHTF